MNNKLKTIIIEDDMVSRMILENYCRNHPNIELVNDFDDVESALAYLSKEKVDLILLDIQLKNSSGFDLLQHIRPETKVIITTGNKDNISIAKKMGINNYLIKPIKLEEFLWSIKNLPLESNEIHE
jgi:response regulator of citrate/malate metabolism